MVLAKYEGYINVEVVFQAIDKLLDYSNESIGNKKQKCLALKAKHFYFLVPSVSWSMAIVHPQRQSRLVYLG